MAVRDLLELLDPLLHDVLRLVLQVDIERGLDDEPVTQQGVVAEYRLELRLDVLEHEVRRVDWEALLRNLDRRGLGCLDLFRRDAEEGLFADLNARVFLEDVEYLVTSRHRGL